MTTKDLVANLIAEVDLLGSDVGERETFSRAVI